MQEDCLLGLSLGLDSAGVVMHETLKCLGGRVGRGKCLDVIAHVAGAVAVGGVAQYRAHGRADRLGMALGWPDDAGDAECLAALGAIGLVAGDREDDQRDALGEGLLDAVEAAVADEQRAHRGSSATWGSVGWTRA